MLEFNSKGDIVESGTTTIANCNIPDYMGNGFYINPYQVTYWNSYPVYICTDKTKKSIEILKMLQKEKKIRCDSVEKFIDLVEKISEIL